MLAPSDAAYVDEVKLNFFQMRDPLQKLSNEEMCVVLNFRISSFGVVVCRKGSMLSPWQKLENIVVLSGFQPAFKNFGL